MKWWLISSEDIQEIREVLEIQIKEVDDQCASTGCMCDLQGQCLCSRPLRDALHHLDTGCHVIDAVASDFANSTEPADAADCKLCQTNKIQHRGYKFCPDCGKQYEPLV